MLWEFDPKLWRLYLETSRNMQKKAGKPWPAGAGVLDGERTGRSVGGLR